MSGPITHALLDQYEKVAGELERLRLEDRPEEALWDLADELLLDLHLIRHGYAKEGYEKHVERRLIEECFDEGVVQRMKELRF